MAESELKEGRLTVTRQRCWGQYRRPNEPVLVKLPADADSMPRYIKKGFTFIKYGGDDLPIAILDTSEEQLKKITPESEPAILPEEVVIEEPELYVSDKPPKERKHRKKKKMGG
jgi:hypothetical protein